MLFDWPSWCWKTTKAKALAWDNLIVIDVTDNLTAEQLLWHFVYNADDKMVFMDWPLTDAVRNWKTVLLNEINTMPTGLSFIFNWITELVNWELGSLSVITNWWEIIKAHPDFRIIGTMNKGYLWTRDLWMSFLSRFISINMSPMDKEDEIALLSQRYPSVDIVQVTFLAELEAQLRNDKDFTYDISTRDLDLALILISNGLPLEVALNNKVFSNLILDLDREIYKRIFSNVKKNLWV